MSDLQLQVVRVLLQREAAYLKASDNLAAARRCLNALLRQGVTTAEESESEQRVRARIVTLAAELDQASEFLEAARAAAAETRRQMPSAVLAQGVFQSPNTRRHLPN